MLPCMVALQFIGASGDNSFEDSVAYKVLPIYLPTNSRNDTFNELQEIAQLPQLNLSEDVRKALSVHFTINLLQKDPPPSVDFKALVKGWPIIADFLKENRNIYHQLTNIVLEDLPLHLRKRKVFVKFIKNTSEVDDLMASKIRFFPDERKVNENRNDLIQNSNPKGW